MEPADELAAVVREVRDRVRARYPREAGVAGVPLADLMPLVRARDAAEAKVAAIGSVNPRPAGPLNAMVQGAKRAVARLLDWHVREQVEFNRGVMASFEAVTEAFNETNRALAALANQMGELRESAARLQAEAEELTDVRRHWAEWRPEWERKLAHNEMQFLRSVADLQGAFQHRVTLIETSFRELVQAQHGEFTLALERSALEVQKRLWADLEKVRLEYERLIHDELRVMRQRAAVVQVAPAAAPAGADILAFADRFRGSEESVRERQRFYLPFFAGCAEVLDIGCGRGEFLELMREAGVRARGIDLGGEAVELCRSKGLTAESADLFPYLEGLGDRSLGGIFCAQVVEHLAPARLPDLVRLAAAKLRRGGVLALETPNPGCLAIFAAHFYLDPTHTRPVPHPLLAFYMREHGLGAIELHELSPASDAMPELASLPEAFRARFFGGLDYAIIGRKL